MCTCGVCELKEAVGWFHDYDIKYGFLMQLFGFLLMQGRYQYDC